MIRLFSAGAVAGLLAGCGTIADGLVEGSPFGTFEEGGPHIYGGVQVDAHVIGHSSDKDEGFVPFCVLDVPLSAVLDTALLPFTALWTLVRPAPPKE
jgi:uncharacterized protein YceK